MRRMFRITGIAACFLALFLASGGHWMVLQGVAWTRMLVAFTQTDSLGKAIEKTFDGDHPCPMCLKIREGRANEQKPAPVLKWERLPEFVARCQPVQAPPAPVVVVAVSSFVPCLHTDFRSSPPKPPPRAA